MNNTPIEILLAEDNEDDVVLIEESFAEAKLVNMIQVVPNGVELLAYLRKEGDYTDAKVPGLILMDINMPKMNGFEALQEIKSDPHLKHIPVIMLTTSDRDEDIVQSYSDGACSYVTKPVDFDKLKNVANQFSLYWAMVSRIPPTDNPTMSAA